MFTPVETSIGAVLLHQAMRNLLYQNGNILGLSGFMRRLLFAPEREIVAFFVGMAVSHVALQILAPHLLARHAAVSVTWQTAPVIVGIGWLMGWGATAANGCTSGHMLCGLSRLSGRSAAAVAVFFPVAWIAHHLARPALSTSVCPESIACYQAVYPPSSTVLSLVLLASLSILAARTIPHLIVTLSTRRTRTEEPFAGARAAARIACQFFSGLLFALGLHVSGMADPAKVSSFFALPVVKHWDPSLALVLLFGVLPSLVEIQRSAFNAPPSFADSYALPTKTLKDVDKRFVAGAAAFGVGWGLTGTCPGPAVLRTLAQPLWGALWIAGFGTGSKLAML